MDLWISACCSCTPARRTRTARRTPPGAILVSWRLPPPADAARSPRTRSRRSRGARHRSGGHVVWVKQLPRTATHRSPSQSSHRHIRRPPLLHGFLFRLPSLRARMASQEHWTRVYYARVTCVRVYRYFVCSRDTRPVSFTYFIFQKRCVRKSAKLAYTWLYRRGDRLQGVLSFMQSKNPTNLRRELSVPFFRRSLKESAAPKTCRCLASS